MKRSLCSAYMSYIYFTYFYLFIFFFINFQYFSKFKHLTYQLQSACPVPEYVVSYVRLSSIPNN